MDKKTELVNSLVMKLADRGNLTIQDVKYVLIPELHNYNVTEIGSTELSVKDGSATISLFNYFRIGKLSSNKSEKSLEQYELVVKQLCNFVNKELNMITTDDINYFLVDYKRINNIKDSTMETKRLYLSSVFTYLHAHGKIAYNPMSLVDSIKYKKCVKTVLSDEEIERIKIVCENDRRTIAMVAFFLDTAVRVTELCEIKLQDVDFQKRRCKVLGKGNKERYVYFNGGCYIRLIEYLKTRKDIKLTSDGIICDDNTTLFATKDKNYNPMHKSGVESIVKKLANKSGILRLHSHLFRATVASRWAEQGVDINIIARALGHANLNTVQRYVLLSEEQIESALRQTRKISI